MRQLSIDTGVTQLSTDMTTVETSIASGVSPETVAGFLSNNLGDTIILDSRPFMAYNGDHITTATNVHCPPILKRRSNGFISLENIVPCETKRQNLLDGHYENVIVYDENTTDLATSAKDSNLYSVLKSLRQQVELTEVHFIIGGFHSFASEYPALCAGSNGNTPCLTLQNPPKLQRSNSKAGPVEITPGLFLGDSQHSSQQETLRALGITSLLNVSTTCKNFFESEFAYMNIPVNDNDTADLSCWFNEAIHFIDSVLDNDGKVLVHCHAGISRSATICIAYLMFKNSLSLEKAFDHVRSRRGVISPNLNFMQQLMEFEKDIIGARSFDLPDSVSDLSSSLASVEFDFSVVSSPSTSDYTTTSASSSSFDFSFATPAIPQSPRTPLMSSI